MEFAVQLGGGQVRQGTTGIEVIVEQARLAEDLGFAVVFVPDHYAFESLGTLMRDTPVYEMFFVLATLAQRTKRVKLGSHVACMLFRHPAMTARLFAQVDEASGGRVIAGVGAGWTRAEFEMMGIPFPDISERLEIMDEAVEIMRGLWREPSYSFAGKHFRIREACCLPKPVQKPGPPIMLGGSGNGILRRAGQWADIIHMIPQTGKAGTTTIENIRAFTDQAVREKLARVRRAEASAGRPAGSVRFATTIFSYTMTSTVHEARTIAENMSGLFGLSPEELRKHPIALIGTAEEIREELRRREGEHGLSLVAINFTSTEQIRDFGERVIHRW